MIIREYYHLPPGNEGNKKNSPDLTSKLFESQVKYKNKTLLAVQRKIDSTGVEYVVVPGIILKYHYKTHGKDETPVSKIQLIQSPSNREEISDLIEKAGDLEGNVYFW